jgi:hypothetical protein
MDRFLSFEWSDDVADRMNEEKKMTYTEHIQKRTRERGRLRTKLLPPMVCSILASIGIFGGLSSITAGFFCAVIHEALAGETAFGQVSTVLMIMGIPMMLLGSILIDEIGPKEH